MTCPIKALITYFEGPFIMRDIMRDIQTRRTNYSMRPRDGFFFIIMRDAGKTIPLQLSLLTTIIRASYSDVKQDMRCQKTALYT